MADLRLSVRRQVPAAVGADGTFVVPGGNAMGFQVVQDFYTWAMLQGAGFQVRAGTITTPLVGDVVITDTAAEYCVDVPNGYTILPVYNNISIRLGTGTVHEYAIKSVATASTVGTAFVPLPLILGGSASTSTARVSAAGGVTVTAELATTTRRHWSFSNPVAAGAGHEPVDHNWEPLRPPPIKGGTAGTCLYVQIAAGTTGPSYYASLDFLEFQTANLI